jgi:hypothetical protein
MGGETDSPVGHFFDDTYLHTDLCFSDRLFRYDTQHEEFMDLYFCGS